MTKNIKIKDKKQFKKTGKRKQNLKHFEESFRIQNGIQFRIN